MASQREIKVKGQKLSTVTSLEHFFHKKLKTRSPVKDCTQRIAQATAALIKPKPIWRDGNKSLRSKGDAKVLPCHYHISVSL